jgi:hypothetical protein
MDRGILEVREEEVCSSKMNSLNKRIEAIWVLVSHAYNPSYLGGRDQKDLCPDK